MERNGLLPYVIFALTLLIICDELSAGRGESLSLGTLLIGNQIIISKNGTFEKDIIVWLANKMSPAKNKPSVLKLSNEGNLGMYLWSVNVSNKCPRAVLLDSGSFLMLSNDNKSEILWQSFDYPVDTSLPQITNCIGLENVEKS
ncbi:hypothetical protein SUGI_0543820 [Cryptomeria japonica]|nr:hypothetical protein SUGI_0543820 [Cryptomeria japonica]